MKKQCLECGEFVETFVDGSFVMHAKDGALCPGTNCVLSDVRTVTINGIEFPVVGAMSDPDGPTDLEDLGDR